MDNSQSKPIRPSREIAEEVQKENNMERLLSLCNELGKALEREREDRERNRKATQRV